VTAPPGAARKVRVLRVIARLNIGGPAHHVSILSGRLDPERFETLLVAGEVGRGEGSFDDLAARHGARVRRLPSLGPDLRAGSDLPALRALARIVRGFQPDIVHTHTAKAGTLGRLAALAAGRGDRRPIVIHTYHGHVLSGYFSPAKTSVFRGIERALARISDRLVGVSQATVDELVAMRIAPADRFRVVPIGLDLDPFLAVGRTGDGALRAELGARPDELLALFVGRLAPIKRVDVLLEAVAHARRAGAPVQLAVAGDGDLRPALEARARELGLTDAVTFLGFRRDLPELSAASDVAVLSSDNEGTPVSLIEAAAAGLPSIATAVGGVADIVVPGTGHLVAPGDAVALGQRLADAARDPEALRQMGATARGHVRDAYGAERLLRDVAGLYDELLAARGRA